MAQLLALYRKFRYFREKEVQKAAKKTLKSLIKGGRLKQIFEKAENIKSA